MTYILVFIGILSSIAADAGYLVLIPLAAAAFLSLGRHPLAGLAASFAGVAAVFTVNILIKPLDGILTGITNDAIHLLDPIAVDRPDRELLVLRRVGAAADGRGRRSITDKIVEPRLGHVHGRAARSTSRRATVRRRSRAASSSRSAALLGVLAVFALL